MPLDIRKNTQRQAEELGVEVEVAEGVFIKVAGQESERAKTHEAGRVRDQVARRLARTAKGQKIEHTSDLYDYEEFDGLAIERAAKMTLDWRGIEADGVAVPFSAEAARELYGNYPRIRRMVLGVADDSGKFWTGGAPSSPISSALASESTPE